MRIDIFWPFLRKAKKGVPTHQPHALARLARRVLPASWFSDAQTGKPGALRRWLKWIGPSWLSSPARRLTQAAFFTLFLLLFFYVCWPYSARPASQWGEWSVAAITAETGAARVARDPPPAFRPRAGDIVHVSDLSIAEVENQYVGSYRVVAAKAGELELEPHETILLQARSAGPWRLQQRMPGDWPTHYTDNLAGKEWVHAELLLVIDPLVSISTALAAKSWVWSLTFAAIILAIGVIVPRGFCGYVCPLGTLIDLFDWGVANRVRRPKLAETGWWVHIKYYLLLGTLVASLCGVLLTGYVAAIPVITRGMLFVFEPLQMGLARGWHQVPPPNAGHFVSIGLFLAVLALGFLKPRFWCKYVCPSGAVFSLGNLFRATERKVEHTCIHCNKCVEICPFDAIKPDFTTRVTDCTLCQTCGGVCPTQAIKFVDRWNLLDLKVENDPPTGETKLGRRGFLSLAAGVGGALVGGAAAAVGTKAFGADLAPEDGKLPVRPPGSVPEPDFLQLCIRCGECFKACPNHVLQAQGFEQGLEGLWTPRVAADWAGCEPSCNACGQVCPTGAIRALPLAEKQVARMGLAILNAQTCLPLAGKQDCQLCVDECQKAGYNAIEFTRAHTEVDEAGQPVEGSGFLAPVVLADKCVGCGLCQTACHLAYVTKTPTLAESAIIVRAGAGREDRLFHGSYLALRRAEAEAKAKQRGEGPTGSYLPDFLESPEPTPP